MEADRTENAIQRIEAALARIAKAADDRPATPPAQSDTAPQSAGTQVPASVSQLVVRHEALREEVAAQIRRIDDLIGKLGQ